MFTRRTFLNSSAAAFAARLFAAPAGAKKPNPELENLGAVALREAKKRKATYCDIRIIRSRAQGLNIRLNPERGTGKTLEVPGVADGGSFGFGVRWNAPSRSRPSRPRIRNVCRRFRSRNMSRWTISRRAPRGRAIP